MGTWDDQWWRIRQFLTAGRIAGVATVIALAIGGYLLWQVDWAIRDNIADLPEVTDTIDSSLVKLRSVRIGDVDALETTPNFTWSQFVPVEIDVDCAPGRFRLPDPNRKWGEPRKHKPGKLRASLGVQIVRKSSLGDGVAEEYTALSGGSINQNHQMHWRGNTWIPHYRGNYRVRVIMITLDIDEQNVRHKSEPIVIGTFNLKVLPGEPAT
ncbi:MAG: hypothetical protein R3F11_33385 [Verrucomicrobiales bacterium]